MDFEHERRLTDVEGRCKANTHRIDKLEESAEAINRLATSMEVMANKQDQVAESVVRLDGKVTALESKPAKRWDAMVDKIVWLVLGSCIAFLLSEIGL